MSFASIIFTNKGKTLQGKAEAGEKLEFTRIVMGNGELGSNSIRNLTNVINKIIDVPISDIIVGTDGTARIQGVYTNEELKNGFYWREIGLFANDPDVGEILYCYGNAYELAEYIPQGESSEIVEKVIELIAIIGDAENVVAEINDSLVYVTYDKMPQYYICSIDHRLNKYPFGQLVTHEYAAGIGGAGVGGAGGGNLEQVPLKIVHKGKNSIDIYSNKKCKDLGTPDVVKGADNMYHITFSDTKSLTLILI